MVHSLRRPAELLVVLPYQLGYHPTQSVVVVAVREHHLVLMERFDLPEMSAASQPEQAPLDLMIAPALRALVHASADEVHLVGYDSYPGESDAMVWFLAEQIRGLGIGVSEALWVRDGRWGSLLDGGSDDRLLGSALPRPEDVPAVADFVALGAVPASSRSALTELIAPSDKVALDAVARSIAARQRHRRATAVPSVATLTAWRRVLSTPDPWSIVDGDSRFSAATTRDIAAAANSLTNQVWRDAIIAWLCPGTLPLEQVDAGVMSAVRTLPRPTGSLPSTGAATSSAVRRLQASLLRMCRHIPDACEDAAAATLTVAATYSWWRGDGSLARVCLDRALAIQPDYRLAALMAQAVDLGIPVGCAASAPDGSAGGSSICHSA